MEVASVAVRIFDVSELDKVAVPPIDGEPFRIRLRFDADTGRTKRKKAVAFLRKIGYRQVGNTSSWILSQKPLEAD